MKSRYRFLIVFILTPIATMSCSRETPQYSQAPETTELNKKADGYLIVNQGSDAAAPDRSRILAVSCANLKQRVFYRAPDNWPVWSVAGPDREGRIAFVENDFMAGEYALKTILLNGKDERQIFKRRGDLIWKKSIGEYLALSPTGGLVAFIGQGFPDQNPGALLTLGPIELWDLNKNTGRHMEIIAVDEPLAWSPDGKELAFVELKNRAEIPTGDSLPGSPFGKEYERKYGRWEKYPVVCILNVETGRKRLLLPGWQPIFTPDWHSVLVVNGDDRQLMSLKDHAVRKIEIPANWQGQPKFLLNDDLVIFEGPPTTGTQPRWIKYGSFKVGTQLHAIKFGSLSTGMVQTILSYADFRDQMSFGMGSVISGHHKTIGNDK